MGVVMVSSGLWFQHLRMRGYCEHIKGGVGLSGWAYS